MDFRILGPLEVRDRDRELRLRGGKQRALLALLLVNPNRTLAIDWIVDELWGEDVPESAQKMVQIYVSQLRKVLPPGTLHTRPPGYALVLEPDELDLHRFETIVAEARVALDGGRAEQASAGFRTALELWRGPALAEFASEPFAPAEGARLEELRVRALEGRLEADLLLGRHGDLVSELEALVARYPLREGLRRQHMLALYRSGRQVEALAAYQGARRVLADELGIEPSPALRDLERKILQQDSSLDLAAPPVAPSAPGPGSFSPLATLAHGPSNLPTQTSDFLGREAQLEAIGDLLETESVRLLTLTGPGGIGKTRLALQAAAGHIDRLDDGAFFVDLSPVRDPDRVPQAVVQALGVTGDPDEPPAEMLEDHLRSRQLLLVLDNFEHVMDAAAGIADLLLHCPRLTILVTSREALRVRGERLFPVPPLSLPDDSEVRPRADLLADYEAVRLFVERARATEPGFALTDENAAAVAEICLRLDGLPLAIELAAARLKLFSPADMRDRLRSRRELLGRGPRDLPDRQRTLRSTIEWSYELLDEQERAIFRLLSVFAPTGVEAVEEVVDRLGSLEDVDVVDRLASLVDKSLVRSLEGPGARRLSMLETIREYAAERLDEEPEFSSGARQAHAEHFAEFARKRRDDLHGPAREDTLDELESELGNLLAAWRQWVAAGDLEQLGKLLDGLWVLHDARGWYQATLALANDLLGALSAAPSTPDRAREEITLRTSLARGLLALRGYTQEVEEAYGRALALAEEVGELPRRLPALSSLARFHLYRGEFDKAATVGRQLLDLAKQQDDAGLQVEGHLVVGSNLAFDGDVATGMEHLDRAIALFDRHEYQPGPLRLGPISGVVAHTTSAFLLWLLGSPDRAAERAATAVKLARQLNHPITLAYALFHVGFLAFSRRELALAQDRASEVLDVAEAHDYQIWRALGRALQGAAQTGLGRPEGLARIDQGIALYQGLKTPPVFWPLLLSLRAGGFAFAGRPADGLDLIDEAIAITGERNVLYPEFALLRGDLLQALGDADGAERCFRSVFDVAGDLALRMPQLRVATRLTRLQRDEARRRDASELLRRVYETFTEGLDTRDLVEARAALAAVDLAVT
jgi:predicted ATPase/DNA-binding SARP family transcriptional activator